MDLSAVTLQQRERLAFLELRLCFLGEIRRQDLIERFEIQSAAATRDLALYRQLAPENLEFNSRSKSYLRTDAFCPLFCLDSEQVFTWLVHRTGEIDSAGLRHALPFDKPVLPSCVNLDNLSCITRAIHNRQVVMLGYRSLSSGFTTRKIVPNALAFNGLRWMVRAFDRRNSEFRDFALSRVEDAQIMPGDIAEVEQLEQDIQWNRIVELDLVPHPANVHHPDALEFEYGMKNGSLPVNVRAALAGYLLRSWNVDCTEDHSLKGREYHLWLRNSQALYGVHSAVLAPGYQPVIGGCSSD